MTANLMNLHGAKPRVTADGLLGRAPKDDGSWPARAHLFFESMVAAK